MSESAQAEMPVNISQEVDPNWIVDCYFPSLSQEKASALEQLHSPTNWGLTLVTTALFLVITRQGFPDVVSLYVLLITLVVGTHFFTRTIKGYINLLRFTFLQRSIAEAILQDKVCNTGKHDHVSDMISLIDTYHLKWSLPIRRRDVFIKGLFELGYAYILGIVTVVLVLTTRFITMDAIQWASVILGIAAMILEIVFLARSSYMKTIVPSVVAKKMK